MRHYKQLIKLQKILMTYETTNRSFIKTFSVYEKRELSRYEYISLNNVRKAHVESLTLK